MDSIESKAKTVDEAIFNGLNKLGVGIDEVDIDILHEGSKGFFGLGKSALVKLTIRKEEPKPVKPLYEPKKEFVSKHRDPRDYSESEAIKRVINPEDIPEGAEAPVDFLNGLFDLMKIDARCEAIGGDEKIFRLDIVGKDTAVLIGRRGDTLDALQYLTGLVINRGKEDYKKIMLDAENYRKKREATLEKLAKRLASNVIKSGKPVTLEPMNPYERRILHATLQSNPKVETHSEGDEPYRKVVIKRKRREKTYDRRVEEKKADDK